MNAKFLSTIRLTRPATRRSLPAQGLLFVASGGLGDAVLLAQVFGRFRKLAENGEKITILMRNDAAKMAFLFGDDIEI